MNAVRPLTIADILDRTVPIMVRRWRIVVAAVAIAATPDALIIALTRGHDLTRTALLIELVLAVLAGALAYPPLLHLGAEGEAAPNDVGAALRRALTDYGRSLGSFVLVYAVLFVFFAIVVVLGMVVAFAARFILGPVAPLIIVLVVGLLAFVSALPLVVVTSVGYANAVLEQANPWHALMSAARRVRRDRLPRTFLLGAVLLLVTVLPLTVIDSLLRPLARMPGTWWVLLPEPYLSTATGIAFATVAGAVAAVDYRNRSEGADLHAVLDAPASAT